MSKKEWLWWLAGVIVVGTPLVLTAYYENPKVQVNSHQIQQSITFCKGDAAEYISLDYLKVNAQGETFVMCENGASNTFGKADAKTPAN